MVSAKKQHRNIILAITIFNICVLVVVLIGVFATDEGSEPIQGEVEVTEYRVSGKVPGRIVELRVQEGDHVEVGDTLAIIDAPELRAKLEQAQGAEARQRPWSRKRATVPARSRYAVPTSSGSRPRPGARLPRSHTSVWNTSSRRA